MKTIADALAEKGRKEERKKSHQKVIALQEQTVQRMLQKNMNIELIHEITGLTIERIKVIQKKMGL